MTTFLIILFAIGVWAVSGHVIWLIFAAFFNACRSKTCPACKAVVDYTTHTCTHCGAAVSDKERRRRDSVKFSIEDDFAGALRLVQLAKFRGWVTSEKGNEVDALLDYLGGKIKELQTKSAAEKPSSTEDRITAPPIIATKSGVEVEHRNPLIVPAATLVVPAHALDEPPAIAKHALEKEYEPVRSEETDFRKSTISKRLTVDVLSAFMQQANVRWIELISAALIVVCSVGLVVSLWSTLAATSRFFPALVFCLATIAIHAAGHYTLSQWKLRRTSRGILQIANMLIPLSVMVGILLSKRDNTIVQLEFFSLLAIVAGGAVYSSLAWWTSRALFGRHHWFVTSTIVASSVSLLVTHLAHSWQRSDLLACCIAFLPLLVCNWAAAMHIAVSNENRISLGRTLTGRLQSLVYQILFSTLAAVLFFNLRFLGQLSSIIWFWYFIITFLCCWMAVSFGVVRRLSIQRLTTLNSPLKGVAERIKFGTKDFFVLVAWTFFVIATPLVALALYKVGGSRIALSLSLITVTVWQLVLARVAPGVLSRIFVALGGTFTLAVVIEGAITQQGEMYFRDWLLFPKVGACLIAGTLSALLAYMVKTEWRLSMLQSGFAHIVLATVLTSIAALLQVFGLRDVALWPEILLATLGFSALVSSVVMECKARCKISVDTESYHRFALGVCTLGLLFISFAVVHLVQINPYLQETIVLLRPTRSIGIVFATISLLSSLFAVASVWMRKSYQLTGGPNLLTKSSPFGVAELLALTATFGAVASLPFTWWPVDSSSLLLRVGWTVPVAMLAASIVYKRFEVLELFRLVTAAWGAFVLFHIGFDYGWWPELRLATAVSLHSALVIVTLNVLCLLDKWLLPSSDRFNSSLTLYGVVVGLVGIALVTVVPGTASLWIALNSSAAMEIGLEVFKSLQLNECFAILASVIVMIASAMTAYRSSLAPRLNKSFFFAVGSVSTVIVTMLLSWTIHPPANVVTILWACLLTSFATTFLSRKFATYKNFIVDGLKDGVWTVVTIGLAILSCLCMFNAYIGSSMAPLIQDWRVVGLKLSALDLLLPTLQWTLPLWFWLAAVWYHTSRTERHDNQAVMFGFMLAFWTAAALLLIEPMPLIDLKKTFILGLQWLIVSLTSLILVQIALTNVLKRGMLQSQIEANQAYAFGFAAFIAQSALCVALLLEMAQLSPNRYDLDQYFGGIVATLSVLLHFVTCIFVPNFRGQLRDTRAIQFPLLLITLPTVFKVAAVAGRQFTPRAVTPVQWLESIGFVAFAVATAMLVQAVLLFIRESKERGEAQLDSPLSNWARCFFVLRSLVFALMISLCFFTPLLGVSASWVVTLYAVISMACLFWSFHRHVLAWGVASAMAMTISLLVWQTNLAWTSVWEVVCFPLFGPLLVSFGSIALQIVRTRLNNSGTNSELEESDWTTRLAGVYQARVEAFVAFGLSGLLTLISLMILLDGNAEFRVRLATYTVLLALGGLLLTVWLALRFTSRLHLRQAYFAMFPLVLFPTIWLLKKTNVPEDTQLLYWIVGAAATLAINAAVLRTIHLSKFVQTPTNALARSIARIQTAQASRWMQKAAITIGILLLMPAVVLVLGSSNPLLRSSATAIPFLLALALVWLPDLSESVRKVALGFLSAASIFFGIQDLPAYGDSESAFAFIHVTRIVISGAFLSIAYTAVAARRMVERSWYRSLYQFSWCFIFVSAIAAVLSVCIAVLNPSQQLAAELSTLEKIAVLLSLIAIIARTLQFAVRPFADEIGQTIKSRQFAVYGVELLLIILGTQFYICYPMFFTGWFVRWWPVAVFLIVLASLGIGRLVRVEHSQVFGSPIRRTNLLLPLIPLFSIWMTP